MTTETEAAISQAERFIRAFRIRESDEDQESWTARWAALLEEATIEDAEAVSADLIV